jgi:hypothetical protein
MTITMLLVCFVVVGEQVRAVALAFGCSGEIYVPLPQPAGD